MSPIRATLLRNVENPLVLAKNRFAASRTRFAAPSSVPPKRERPEVEAAEQPHHVLRHAVHAALVDVVEPREPVFDGVHGVDGVLEGRDSRHGAPHRDAARKVRLDLRELLARERAVRLRDGHDAADHVRRADGVVEAVQSRRRRRRSARELASRESSVPRSPRRPPLARFFSSEPRRARGCARMRP